MSMEAVVEDDTTASKKTILIGASQTITEQRLYLISSKNNVNGSSRGGRYHCIKKDNSHRSKPDNHRTKIIPHIVKKQCQ